MIPATRGDIAAQRMLDAGAADYVTEPLAVVAFLEAVRDALAVKPPPY